MPYSYCSIANLYKLTHLERLLPYHWMKSSESGQSLWCLEGDQNLGTFSR